MTKGELGTTPEDIKRQGAEAVAEIRDKRDTREFLYGVYTDLSDEFKRLKNDYDLSEFSDNLSVIESSLLEISSAIHNNDFREAEGLSDIVRSLIETLEIKAEPKKDKSGSETPAPHDLPDIVKSTVPSEKEQRRVLDNMEGRYSTSPGIISTKLKFSKEKDGTRVAVGALEKSLEEYEGRKDETIKNRLDQYSKSKAREEKSQRRLADAERQYSGIQAMSGDISTRLKSAQDKLLLLAKKGEEIREKSKGVFGFFRKLSGSLSKEQQSNKLAIEEAENLSEKLKSQLDQANKEMDVAHTTLLTATTEAKQYEEEDGDEEEIEEAKEDVEKKVEVMNPGGRIESFTFDDLGEVGININSIKLNPDHEFTRDLGGVAITSSVTNLGGPRSKYPDNEDVHLSSVNSENSELRDAAGAVNIITVDGAGGSKDGQLAAVIATDQIAKSLAKGKSMDEALLEASETVFTDLNNSNFDINESSYCCATAIQIRRNGEVTIGYVGDTKVMTIRDGNKLEEGTTKLQNFARRLQDGGLITLKEYYTHENNNVIMNSIGQTTEGYLSEKDPSLKFQGRKNDILIAASDGLWDIVSEYEVEELTRETSEESPDGTIDPKILQAKLFQLAYQRNNDTEPFVIRLGPEKDNIVNKRRNGYDKEGNLIKGGDNITISVTRLDLRTPEIPAVVEKREEKEEVVKNWFREKVVNNKKVRETLVAASLFGASIGLAIFGPDLDESDYAPEQPSVSKQSPDLEKFPDQDAEMTFDIDEVPVVDADNIEDDIAPDEIKMADNDKEEVHEVEKSDIDLSDEMAKPGSNPIAMLNSIIERPGMREAIINSERNIHPEYRSHDDDWVVKRWRTKQWWSSFRPTVDKATNTVNYNATVRADKQKTTLAFIQTQESNGEIIVFWNELGGSVSKQLPSTNEDDSSSLPDLHRPAEALDSVGERAEIGPLETKKLSSLQSADDDEIEKVEDVDVPDTVLEGAIPDTGERTYIAEPNTDRLNSLIYEALDDNPENIVPDANDTDPAIVTLRKKIKELIALKKKKDKEKRVAKLKKLQEKLKG